MPYAAISYRVKEGYEDELAELFANIGRVSSPVLHDESGNEVGKLLGTAVFIEGPMIVRFIHYSGGTLADVGRHMSNQPAIHAFEEELQPYLAQARDTTSPEAFRQFFAKSTMRCLTQVSVDTLKPEATSEGVELE
ncbi:SchA/CurD-like domain-containing protein [Saccharomonospora sp.]|uniref:SchA/CurD-like domain-containing protein n=1 Tax=Saccharomonospora sp. TaxID=33913 RepID=UPI00263992FF|nr:SchA/CurD-like domain-containing protein [Saccharomonospora sp.]